MAAIRSFADIEEGALLPPLERHIDRQQLIRFAGAVDDYAEPHWNHQMMVESGFPGVIVHGWLTFSVMCETVAAWVPLEIADFKTYSVRYHKPNFPGRAIYGGRVARKSGDGGVGEADLEIWVENAEGVKIATGNVTLAFV